MEAFAESLISLPGMGWLGQVENLAQDAGIPAGVGSVAFLAVVVAAVVLGLIQATSDGSESGGDMYGDDILVVGACGSGKTALVQTIATSKMPQTVSSTQVDEVQLETGEDGESTTLIDFPGHATLRPRMQELWNNVSGVVVAMDSKLPGEHLRDTAECLVNVLTSPGFAMRDEPCPLLVVATKTDQAGALPLGKLESLLNAEMERKRQSREHIARDARGDAAPGDDDGSGAGEAGIEDQVVLGVAGEPFSLRKHVHIASQGGDAGTGATVRFLGVSCKTQKGLDAVRSFMLDPSGLLGAGAGASAGGKSKDD